MYEVVESKDKEFNIYELRDSTTNSWVKVAPERGGIIFSYGVQGEELLYLNEETFYNTETNIRGGIPILFPISGQLSNGMYEWQGKTFAMSNHGFARNASWEVVNVEINNSASLTIKLTSNEQTKRSYTFDFEVIFVYELQNGRLTIHQEYFNLGNQPMPMYAGFHPYFKTSDKCLSYSTEATKYFDYNNNQEKEIVDKIDLTNLTEAVVLEDNGQGNISFKPPSLEKQIKLIYDEPFKYIMLWSEIGKEYICVEPWMAKTNEFNRQEELVIVNGKENLKTKFSILVEELILVGKIKEKGV